MRNVCIQFGFQNKQSTSHALITLEEVIKKYLDIEYFVCGAFIGLQKAFDIVKHDILLAKLEGYGLHPPASNW